MFVLFDHGTPRGIAPALAGHIVRQAQAQGWDRLRNGELLDAAGHNGFDVLLTTDKNMRHQQNLAGRRIAVVVLSHSRWPIVRKYLPQIAEAVNNSTPGSYFEVEIPQE